jgi:hypothetical protein
VLVKTTTRLKPTRDNARNGVVSAKKSERINELRNPLDAAELDEQFDDAHLRDFLEVDTSPVSLATQSVLFSLPSPTLGDVAPTHESDADESGEKEKEKRHQNSPLDSQAPPELAVQASAASGPPGDLAFAPGNGANVMGMGDNGAGDLTGSSTADPSSADSRVLVESSVMEQLPPNSSRSLVDVYESVFPLQRRAAGYRAPLLPRLQTGGRELPEAVRSKMETAFGVSFDSVRVLVGPEATAIGALAFARGEQIFFAPGQYDPLSPSGQELLGHELAHVVQQRAGRVRADAGSDLNTDSSLEREADVAGSAAARGGIAKVAGASSSPKPARAVQQKKDAKAKSKGAKSQDQEGSDGAPSVASEDENVKGKLGEDKQEDLEGTIEVKEAKLKGGIRAVKISGTGKLKKGKLLNFSGSATLIIPVRGVDTYTVTCTDLVVKSGGKVDSGTGPLTTLRSIEIAKGDAYTLSIAKGATATGTLAKHEVKTIGGTIKAVLEDTEGVLLDVLFKGEIDAEKTSFDGTATISTGRKIMLEENFGPNNTWSAFIAQGESLTGTFKGNALTEIGPSVAVTISDELGPFVELKLDGKVTFDRDTFKPKMVFEGGTATTKRDFHVYSVAQMGWEVFATAGSSVTVSVTDGKPSGFAGKLPLSVRDAAGELLTLELDGTCSTKGVIDGTATAKLTRDLPFALSKEKDGPSFTVKTDSSGTLTFVKSEPTTLVGTGIGLFSTTIAETPVEIEVTGAFSLDVPKNKLNSASGIVNLTKPIDFPKQGLRLASATGKATLKGTTLESVEGTLEVVRYDDQGDAVKAKVQGSWSEAKGIAGTGTATLLRDYETVVSASTGTSVTILKGTAATAVFDAGKLKTLSGVLNASLAIGGVPRASLVLNGTYDFEQKKVVKATGTASLLEPIALLDGKATITGATLTAAMVDGKLTQVAGTVKLTAPSLKVKEAVVTFGWRNVGGEDLYSASGTIDWTFFEEGDRKLSGKLSIDYREDKTFTATAAAAYQMNKHIKGGGTVKVDEQLEPEVLEGWLTYSQTLIEPRDLFRMNLKLFELTIPVGIPGVNIEFGMSMGTGLALDALPVEANIKLAETWKLKPDDKASRTPAFETKVTPKWGATFDANVAAWLGLALGAAIAKVALGVKGRVILKVNVSTAPELTLGGGGNDGFYGNLKVGAKVTPTLSLQIVPYASASLGSFYDAEKELPGFEHPLAKFAGLDWAMEYGFGDRGPSAKKAASAPEIGGSGSQDSAKTKKEMTFNKTASKSGDGKTTPAMDGESIANEQQSKANAAQGEGEGKSRSKLEMIISITKGLGALEKLISLFGGAVKAFLLAGPFGFAAYLAWKAFKGELSWDKIVAQVTAVQEAFSSIRELLADKLNPKVSLVLGILGGDLTIKDALFGNKSKMIAEVARGAHREVAPEVRSDMVNVLINGFCTGEAETMAFEVLKYSAGQGDLKIVMLTVNGGPDAIIGCFDGGNSASIKVIFKSAGVPYLEGLSRIFGVGEDSGGKLAEEQLTDVDNLEGTPSKRRAGIIDRLIDGGKKNGNILTVVAKSKVMGDLPEVVELVTGGVKAIRRAITKSDTATVNILLFLSGVTSLDGLSPVDIPTHGLEKMLPEETRVAAIKSLLNAWYLSEAEAASVVAIVTFASDKRGVIKKADSTAKAMYSRMGTAEATAFANLFGGVNKL